MASKKISSKKKSSDKPSSGAVSNLEDLSTLSKRELRERASCGAV